VVKALYAESHLQGRSSIVHNMPMRMQRHYIREWRKSKGWTQTRLAEAAGVRQDAISRAETKDAYDDGLLESIALALNVTPADLIMRDPSDPQGLWSIYDQLSATQREQLVKMGNVLIGDRKIG
jgi:transcriptional regulator with XRE-family HTH domain